MQLRKDSRTGDAWPSSVRGLNCSLKWGNERNPCRLLQVSGETAQPYAHEVRSIKKVFSISYPVSSMKIPDTEF